MLTREHLPYIVGLLVVGFATVGWKVYQRSLQPEVVAEPPPPAKPPKPRLINSMSRAVYAEGNSVLEMARKAIQILDSCDSSIRKNHFKIYTNKRDELFGTEIPVSQYEAIRNGEDVQLDNTAPFVSVYIGWVDFEVSRELPDVPGAPRGRKYPLTFEQFYELWEAAKANEAPRVVLWYAEGKDEVSDTYVKNRNPLTKEQLELLWKENNIIKVELRNG